MLKTFALIIVIVVLIVLVSLGFFNKYRFTGKACNGLYYVEFIQTNPFGTDAIYLTDSSTFRYFLGKIDEGNEYYNVECKADSISVRKIAKRGTFPGDTTHVITDQRTISLETLRKHHSY